MRSRSSHETDWRDVGPLDRLPGSRLRTRHCRSQPACRVPASAARDRSENVPHDGRDCECRN